MPLPLSCCYDGWPVVKPIRDGLLAKQDVGNATSTAFAIGEVAARRDTDRIEEQIYRTAARADAAFRAIIDKTVHQAMQRWRQLETT